MKNREPIAENDLLCVLASLRLCVSLLSMHAPSMGLAPERRHAKTQRRKDAKNWKRTTEDHADCTDSMQLTRRLFHCSFSGLHLVAALAARSFVLPALSGLQRWNSVRLASLRRRSSRPRRCIPSLQSSEKSHFCVVHPAERRIHCHTSCWDRFAIAAVWPSTQWRAAKR